MTHVLNVLLFLFFSVVEVFSECRLLSYMAQVENRLFYLYRLISIINVQTLTQASYKIYIFFATYGTSANINMGRGNLH